MASLQSAFANDLTHTMSIWALQKHQSKHRRLPTTGCRDDNIHRSLPQPTEYADCSEFMLPPKLPLCPISAAKIAGLKATVVLLMVMLIKSKLLRVKMSLLGSLLGLVMLTGFLVTTGVLTLVAGGAVAYAASSKS